MLGLPDRIDVRQPDGQLADLPMWTYWYLQEGEIEFDPALFVTADGKESPVLHVDSDQTLRDDANRLITSEPWGVYFKPDRETVQGGAQPLRLGHAHRPRPVPHGHGRARLPRHVVRRAVALPRPVRGRPRRRTARPAAAAPARSPSTTSRCSTTCARTCSSPPTRTTATR